MLGVLPRIVLRALPVEPVLALGLGELVDLRGGESDEEFLGELVRDGLACGGEGLMGV